MENAEKHRNFRKPNRLAGYDYATPGYYFLTICTANRDLLFGHIITDLADASTTKMVLSSTGQLVARAILEIPEHYPGVHLEKYVVMPNHIHLLLVVSDQPEKTVNVSRIVQQFKRAVSMRAGMRIWQEGFHDHIIRGEADYREIWTYIDNNPIKWALDKYFRD